MSENGLYYKIVAELSEGIQYGTDWYKIKNVKSFDTREEAEQWMQENIKEPEAGVTYKIEEVPR